MWAYVVRRILATIPVLAIVALVVFSILHIAPGDPAGVIAGDQATEEQIQAIRAKLRLDLPFHEQFMLWLMNAVQGDLGISIFSNRPVMALFLQRIERSRCSPRSSRSRSRCRSACSPLGGPARRSTAA